MQQESKAKSSEDLTSVDDRQIFARAERYKAQDVWRDGAPETSVAGIFLRLEDFSATGIAVGLPPSSERIGDVGVDVPVNLRSGDIVIYKGSGRVRRIEADGDRTKVAIELLAGSIKVSALIEKPDHAPPSGAATATPRAGRIRKHMDAYASRVPGETVIRVADGLGELEKLYRFRYRIYVEEMRRKQNHADHMRKRIQDPLDDFATNFIAWDSKGEVVGTMRINFARDGDLQGYERFYAMDMAGDVHPKSTSISTRLMTSPAYRGSMLAVQMIIECYEFALANGITDSFIDCNDHLVQFFEGLGLVQYLPKKMHEEYGEVTCMRLSLLDRAHLERVSSPLLKSFDRWQATVAQVRGRPPEQTQGAAGRGLPLDLP